MTRFPRYIGLCGNPKSGKSEVQRLLEEDFGVIPIDDGAVLRDFAVSRLGLLAKDVNTQAGKAEFTEILGKNWQNRDILGTLGKHLEDMFGEHIMPFIATRALPDTQIYSFGSVRKSQGHFYRARGGMVIELVRPGASASPYPFDQYDRTAIDFTVNNAGTLEDLRDTLHCVAAQIGGLRRRD